MKKWINGCIYPCKKIGDYPQIYIQRCMHGKYKGIKIECFEIKGGEGTTIQMTTRYARILIDRLQKALDDTE